MSILKFIFLFSHFEVFIFERRRRPRWYLMMTMMMMMKGFMWVFFPRALITWHHKQNQFFSEILDISEIAEWRVSIIPPYGRPQHSSGHAPRGHAFSWKSFYQLQQPLKTIPFLPFSLHLTLKQMGRGARRDWSA